MTYSSFSGKRNEETDKSFYGKNVPLTLENGVKAEDGQRAGRGHNKYSNASDGATRCRRCFQNQAADYQAAILAVQACRSWTTNYCKAELHQGQCKLSAATGNQTKLTAAWQEKKTSISSAASLSGNKDPHEIFTEGSLQVTSRISMIRMVDVVMDIWSQWLTLFTFKFSHSWCTLNSPTFALN